MTKQEKVWELWRLRANRSVKQHYYSVHWFRGLDTAITVVNVGASIAVLWLSALSASYTGPSATPHGSFGWLAIAGVAVVITSIIQLVLDWRTQWRRHEDAGIKVAHVNRIFELGPNLTKSHLIPRIRWRLTSKTDTRYQKHQSHARFVQNVSEAQYKRE